MVNYNEIKKAYSTQSCFKIVNNFIEYLRNHNLVPALFFVFSRKECEKLAKVVQKSLVTSEEINEIDKIFNYELRHYKKTYEKSPQYLQIHKLLLKGIAYHHSGLIPILKEVIEILFAKGLIKVLFATETFAVGVNMPTKTVIFPKLTKYSNRNFRYLRTDEYLQMAGRAGRRGLDKFGTVIILPCDELMEYTQLKNMMIGKSPCITSKFKLTYQFLLKILNNQEFDLKKFIGNSLFSQDNLQMISKHKVEKQMIQDKLNHGLNESDLKFIVEYKKKEKLLENFRGNARKKESAKLNKLKQELRNFNNVLAKYDSYLKKKEDINRIESSIDYLNTFVDEDSIKMVKYLKENHYIDEDNKVLKKGYYGIRNLGMQ